MKRFVPITLLVLTLLICGCAPDAITGNSGNEAPKVDATEVATGKPAVDGWLDDAVGYCQEHQDAEGILVEFTGEMAETSKAHEEVDTLILVMPTEEDVDAEKDANIKPDDLVAEVHYAKPVERTPWRHLTSVRGIAKLDNSNPNKIIVYGAIDPDEVGEDE